MIERVARSICEAAGNDPDALHFQIPDNDYQEPAWKSYSHEARAAIEAMREPSNSMVWAHEVPHYGPDEAREAWRAMVDAALKEGS